MMPDRGAIRSPLQQRGKQVVLTVGGQRIEAHAGEMLAAALLAAGVVALRQAPSRGGPRGAFCLMGVCQECLVRVGGKLRQACMVTVADGLEVEFIGSGKKTA